MQSKLLPFTRPDLEERLHEALGEHVVFHSPVRDYRGRTDVAHILTTIAGVLDKVEAEHELVGERQLVTIINASHAYHPMSGVLIENYDGLGRVARATLLLRPLSALLEAITAMRAALEESPLPSTRDAPSARGVSA